MKFNFMCYRSLLGKIVYIILWKMYPLTGSIKSELSFLACSSCMPMLSFWSTRTINPAHILRRSFEYHLPSPFCWCSKVGRWRGSRHREPLRLNTRYPFTSLLPSSISLPKFLGNEKIWIRAASHWWYCWFMQWLMEVCTVPKYIFNYSFSFHSQPYHLLAAISGKAQFQGF